MALFNRLRCILGCLLLRACKYPIHDFWLLTFGNRSLTTRVFHVKIHDNLQTCLAQYLFKECSVPWVTRLSLFIPIPGYQMCVDQFINIKEKFYHYGVDINYFNGRFVESLSRFFCLPRRWVKDCWQVLSFCCVAVGKFLCLSDSQSLHL